MAAWRPVGIALGERLRLLREERDLSIVEVAAATGWSSSTLFAWERGARLPSLPGLLGWSAAVGCSLVDVMPDLAHHRAAPVSPREG